MAYCPCGGRCHHEPSPCSLGCWAAQTPWRAEEAAIEARAGSRHVYIALRQDVGPAHRWDGQTEPSRDLTRRVKVARCGFLLDFGMDTYQWTGRESVAVPICGLCEPDDRRYPALLKVEGDIGDTLLVGTDYRVDEIRVHRAPTGEETTVVRFDPVELP